MSINQLRLRVGFKKQKLGSQFRLRVLSPEVALCNWVTSRIASFLLAFVFQLMLRHSLHDRAAQENRHSMADQYLDRSDSTTVFLRHGGRLSLFFHDLSGAMSSLIRDNVKLTTTVERGEFDRPKIHVWCVERPDNVPFI